MIGNVSAAGQAGYTAATSTSNRTASAAESQTASDAPADDRVDLSPGGKLLSSLPPVFLDPKYHMANAENRLNELMTEMGISPDTDIDIHVSNSGQFTVNGDDEKLAELEKRLNDGSEMELRNSLIGAHTASIIHETAMATERTSKQAEANPQAAQTLWNQLIAESERISGQSANFSFSSGTLSGALSGGSSIEIA